MASGTQNLTTYKARNLIHKINDNINLLRVFSRDDVGISPNFDNPGFNGYFEVRSSSETTGESGTKPFNSYAGLLTMKDSSNVSMLQLAGSNAQGWWVRGKQDANITLSGVDWQRIVVADSGTYSINISGNAATATALTSNAGGTEQPIYFTGGKPSATSYYLKANINNGTNNFIAEYSNNGRTIDNGGLLRIPYISYHTVTPDYTNGGERFYKAAMANIATNYSNASNLIGIFAPNSQGPFIGNIYDVNYRNSANLPRYSTFIYHNLGAGLESFGTVDYNYYHREYVYNNATWGISITGNAATASRTNGRVYCTDIGTSWVGSRDAAIVNCDVSSSTSSVAYTLERIKFSAKTYGMCAERASVIYGICGWNNSRTDNGYDGYFYISGDFYFRCSTRVYNAVWNDYAEFRQGETTEGGRVVYDDGSGIMKITTKRLQAAARLVSDTFGIAVGESDTAKTPIGIGGRVLAYTYQNRNNFKVGDAVCAAPNGTVDIMTREEIKEYPDRIIGIVSEIPDYEVWENKLKGGRRGSASIPVKGRIWIYVK